MSFFFVLAAALVSFEPASQLAPIASALTVTLSNDAAAPRPFSDATVSFSADYAYVSYVYAGRGGSAALRWNGQTWQVLTHGTGEILTTLGSFGVPGAGVYAIASAGCFGLPSSMTNGRRVSPLIYDVRVRNRDHTFEIPAVAYCDADLQARSRADESTNISVAPDAQVFGQPVKVEITVWNRSTTDEVVAHGYSACGYTFLVADLSERRALPQKEAHCNTSGDDVSLSPNQGVAVDFKLSNYVDLPHPGLYSIRMEGALGQSAAAMLFMRPATQPPPAVALELAPVATTDSAGAMDLSTVSVTMINNTSRAIEAFDANGCEVAFLVTDARRAQPAQNENCAVISRSVSLTLPPGGSRSVIVPLASRLRNLQAPGSYQLSACEGYELDYFTYRVCSGSIPLRIRASAPNGVSPSIKN